MTDYTRLDKDELLSLLKDLNEAILSGKGRESRLCLDLQAHQVELEMQNRELRESQKQLEEAVSLYSDLYDFAPVGYMTLDRTGRILKLNLTAASMLTDKRDNALHIPFVSFLETKEARSFFDLLRECGASGQRSSAEFTLAPKKRPSVRIHMLAVPFDNEGEINFRVSLLDMTALREAEEKNEALRRELLLAQRMALSERLSGGLLHDFSNVITVISSYAGLASREAGGCRAEHLDGIKDAAGRATSLLRQIQVLNGSRMEEPELLDISTVIPDAAGIVERVAGKKNSITAHLAPDTPKILCRRANFEQLILNLLLISKQYADDGNPITISTGRSVAAAKTYASIEIAFSGRGSELEGVLHEALLRYPAQPRLPNGSLKAIRYIMEALGAKAEFKCADKIELAFNIPAVATEELDAPVKLTAGSGQRILFVEDEALLRKSISIVLSNSGYVVFQASSAVEAVGLFKKEDGRFDLLFTDLVLKGDDGLSLCRRLHDLSPGLKVLFTSGCLDVESEWPDLKRERHAFIAKPFETTDLLRAVAGCLQGANVSQGHF